MQRLFLITLIVLLGHSTAVGQSYRRGPGCTTSREVLMSQYPRVVGGRPAGLEGIPQRVCLVFTLDRCAASREVRENLVWHAANNPTQIITSNTNQGNSERSEVREINVNAPGGFATAQKWGVIATPTVLFLDNCDQAGGLVVQRWTIGDDDDDTLEIVNRIMAYVAADD